MVQLLEKSNAIFLEKSFMILVIQQCQIPGRFGSNYCFRWVCYETTAAHQHETPNLYTSTPMIVMKEKIKPNQEDDFYIEKMRQKSTSFIYILNPEPMKISYGNIKIIVSP